MCYFKRVVNLTYQVPKLASTTIATLTKRMQDKGFVGYKIFGNSRQYYPLINKSDYFLMQVKALIKTYIDKSPLQFASFFTTGSDLTTDELEELIKIVNAQIKKAV